MEADWVYFQYVQGRLPHEVMSIKQVTRDSHLCVHLYVATLLHTHVYSFSLTFIYTYNSTLKYTYSYHVPSSILSFSHLSYMVHTHPIVCSYNFVHMHIRYEHQIVSILDWMYVVNLEFCHHIWILVSVTGKIMLISISIYGNKPYLTYCS